MYIQCVNSLDRREPAGRAPGEGGLLLGRDIAIMFVKATSSITGVVTQLTDVWLHPDVGHFMCLEVKDEQGGGPGQGWERKVRSF